MNAALRRSIACAGSAFTAPARMASAIASSNTRRMVNGRRSRGRLPPRPRPLEQLRGLHRPREVIPLDQVAVERAHELPLLAILHALRDGDDAELRGGLEARFQ